MSRIVLRVEFIDCGTSALRIALPEDLLEITQQQPFDDICHDRVPPTRLRHVKWAQDAVTRAVFSATVQHNRSSIIILMKTPAPEIFRAGRQFGAWIGLTPTDHSTAGR